MKGTIHVELLSQSQTIDQLIYKVILRSLLRSVRRCELRCVGASCCGRCELLRSVRRSQSVPRCEEKYFCKKKNHSSLIMTTPRGKVLQASESSLPKITVLCWSNLHPYAMCSRCFFCFLSSRKSAKNTFS